MDRCGTAGPVKRSVKHSGDKKGEQGKGEDACFMIKSG